MPDSIGKKWEDLKVSIYNDNYKLIETLAVGASHGSTEDPPSHFFQNYQNGKFPKIGKKYTLNSCQGFIIKLETNKQTNK